MRPMDEQHGRPGDASSGRALLQGGRFSSAWPYIMPGEQKRERKAREGGTPPRWFRRAIRRRPWVDEAAAARVSPPAPRKLGGCPGGAG